MQGSSDHGESTLVETFTIHNLSAPHKWGLPKYKKIYAHVILSPP